MAFQILLNALLAFTWMFMNDTYRVSRLCIRLCTRDDRHFYATAILPATFYGYALYAIFKLVIIFIREPLANLSVLKTVLSPKLKIKPGIFAFRTDLKTDWEITILANMITLTPGTLVIDISDDRSILYIHAMDIEDAEKAIHDIRVSFEKAIQEVSGK